jgi:CheY-like chemotaxis protein
VYEAKRAGRDRVFVHRAAEASRMAQPIATSASADTVRVLFVEDDPLAATLITTLLKRQKGVEIQWIESGTRAANEIKRMDAGEIPPVDIFLVDLNLPGISGYELLKMVRASPTMRGLAFLVLSGEDEATSREKCLQLGATEFIPKQDFVTDIGRWVGLITGSGRSKAA